MGLDKHTIAKANIFTCTFSCRTRRLTWHEGFIPASEVWIKIGGDKGSGTFKMNLLPLQFCPQHVRFAVTNLHAALDRFKDQVEHLDGMKWRQEVV